MKRPPSPPFWRLWGWPIALGLLTIAGLISALLGDRIWDHLSAVALGIPVMACLWFGLRR
jgi:hypothetical protein